MLTNVGIKDLVVASLAFLQVLLKLNVFSACQQYQVLVVGSLQSSQDDDHGSDLCDKHQASRCHIYVWRPKSAKFFLACSKKLHAFLNCKVFFFCMWHDQEHQPPKRTGRKLTFSVKGNPTYPHSKQEFVESLFLPPCLLNWLLTQHDICGKMMSHTKIMKTI